jgi:hypothetical protein
MTFATGVPRGGALIWRFRGIYETTRDSRPKACLNAAQMFAICASIGCIRLGTDTASPDVGHEACGYRTK